MIKEISKRNGFRGWGYTIRSCTVTILLKFWKYEHSVSIAVAGVGLGVEGFRKREDEIWDWSVKLSNE